MVDRNAELCSGTSAGRSSPGHYRGTLIFLRVHRAAARRPHQGMAPTRVGISDNAMPNWPKQFGYDARIYCASLGLSNRRTSGRIWATAFVTETARF